MAYAVFTRRSGPHEPAALKAAFEATPLVTATDAQRALRPNSPGGVVTVGLEEGVANALAQELTNRGIQADAVEEGWLSLPQPQTCRRCTVSASELIFHVYDGPLHVPCNQVICITYGVLTSETTVSQGLPKQGRRGTRAARRLADSLDLDRKRVRESELVLDVVIEDPPRRFRFRDDHADIRPESDSSAYRGGGDVHDSLRSLLADIAKNADTAALSLGAERIIKGAKAHNYSSHREFAQELAWLVWRYRGPAVDGLSSPLGSNRMRPGVLALSVEEPSAALDAHMDASVQIDRNVGGALGFAVAAGMCTLMFDGVTFLAFSVFVLLWCVFGAAVFLTLRERRQRQFRG